MPIRRINTQEEFLELEVVEMLICTVAVDPHMQTLMEQEDIHSLVDVLREDIPVVEIILGTICDVVLQVREELTDGFHPT